MFDRIEKLIGESNLNKLKNSCVLVLGVGGVGGYAVSSLVRSGIGKIILVDFDTIDESNINRQLIATTNNIGKYKVDEFEKRIHEINPECIVIKHNIFYGIDNKDDIFDSKIDFVIDACDNITAKKTIITECVRRNIDFISSMGMGKKLHPEKIVIDRLDKTSYDKIAKIMRNWAKDEGIEKKIWVVYSKEISSSNGDVITSYAPVVGVAGLYLSSYVINKIISVN